MNSAQEKKESSNYKNNFYMDYFGSAMRSNGKRYKHSDINEISKLETSEDKTKNIITHVYGVLTNTGARGVLRLYSNAPNYKTAVNFVKKCLRGKNKL